MDAFGFDSVKTRHKRCFLTKIICIKIKGIDLRNKNNEIIISVVIVVMSIHNFGIKQFVSD